MRRIVALLGAIIAGAVVLTAGISGCTTHSAVSWRVVHGAPSDDFIDIAYFHGSCDHLDAPRITVSSEAVRIHLTVRSDGSSECDNAAHVDTIRVELGVPLGERRVEGQCSADSDPTCDFPTPSVPVTPTRTVRAHR